ncbi:MAG: 50S ribosomal protein L23 [Bacteroidota bacterium]
MGVLVRPLVTEKVSVLNEKGKYGFIVDRKANKIEIKKAVEKMYSVTVEDVNTMNYFGKKKSRYTKSKIIEGRTASFKKAVVTVADGDVIDFYGEI